MSNKPANKGTRLGRTLFRVDSETYARFVELLDAPPQPNPRLRTLLLQKPPWE
jgi:uncharacterized protein (DUF1778 family)